MRCIFCKQDSSQTRSAEHIIPESMGNIEHVLPIGTVCNSCNQYFARKIERPLLESPMFRHLRAGMNVPNKRGRIPGWSVQDGINKPNYRLMGRFLAKVGLEVLAFKTKAVPESNEELVEHRQLDEIRSFVRYNVGEDWPFTVRTLYAVNEIFCDGADQYELLHEFDILLTKQSEAYAVLALFGVEMVLNLGGRELDGYRTWLEAHDYASPLYTGKNS